MGVQRPKLPLAGLPLILESWLQDRPACHPEMVARVSELTRSSSTLLPLFFLGVEGS